MFTVGFVFRAVGGVFVFSRFRGRVLVVREFLRRLFMFWFKFREFRELGGIFWKLRLVLGMRCINCGDREGAALVYLVGVFFRRWRVVFFLL